MKIETGYSPGMIGDITALHSRYYNKASGFGPRFEAVVASGLSDFVLRLSNSKNQIWTVADDGRIAASIAIDGEDLGENTAHLRWFITSAATHGTGLGRKLLTEAIAFSTHHGFVAIHLWTFSGLDAARHLYEQNGFKLSEEYQGDQWGTQVTEQKFVLNL